MIKRTLYIGSGYYLSTRDEQLVLKPKDSEEEKTIPIEDIGYIELDSHQITLSNALLAKLADANVAVVVCDAKHHPTSLLLPIEGHSVQAERMRPQIESSLPLRKQLWRQVVKAKISNQADVLKRIGRPDAPLRERVKLVNSGDTTNQEGVAAAYYWKTLIPGFRRDRYGMYPNNLLNYGYAVLRAVIARAVVSAGLHPSLGIHHHNRYNAFCMADDIMEPFRPVVDLYVYRYQELHEPVSELTTDVKKHLLQIAILDVSWGKETRPLMIAAQLSCSSLWKCFAGKSSRLALSGIAKESRTKHV